jgi:hypothetical protein
MSTPAGERQKMPAVRIRGQRVMERRESIAVTELRELARRDPYQLVCEVNLAAGRSIWHPGMAAQAMANIIAAPRQHLEVTEPTRLVYTETIADERGNPISAESLGLPPKTPETTEVTVVLDEVNGGTRVTLTHAGVPAESGAARGWNGAFDKPGSGPFTRWGLGAPGRDSGGAVRRNRVRSWGVLCAARRLA